MAQLSPQESFRLGFLLRCAEEGLDADGIQERVKVANILGVGYGADLLSRAGRSLGNLAKGYATLPLHYGLGTTGAAAALGAGGGYGLAKMQEDPVDSEEAKRQELISAYKMQADRARRRARRRSYRRPAPEGPRLLD